KRRARPPGRERPTSRPPSQRRAPARRRTARPTLLADPRCTPFASAVTGEDPRPNGAVSQARSPCYKDRASLPSSEDEEALAMKFGLIMVPQVRKGEPEPFDNLMEQIEFAEELGYDAIWLTEHHFSEYGRPAVPALAGHAIARTSRMRIS